jgi:hypothetical protein
MRKRVCPSNYEDKIPLNAGKLNEAKGKVEYLGKITHVPRLVYPEK